MELFEKLAEAAKAAGLVPTALSEATEVAPNSMGCYKIFCKGSLKYVGKAEDGIRNRFVQYCNGTWADDSSAVKIYENRHIITVSWVELKTREECRETEAKWIEELKPLWNK